MDAPDAYESESWTGLPTIPKGIKKKIESIVYEKLEFKNWEWGREELADCITYGMGYAVVEYGSTLYRIHPANWENEPDKIPVPMIHIQSPSTDDPRALTRTDSFDSEPVVPLEEGQYALEKELKSHGCFDRFMVEIFGIEIGWAEGKETERRWSVWFDALYLRDNDGTAIRMGQRDWNALRYFDLVSQEAANSVTAKRHEKIMRELEGEIGERQYEIDRILAKDGEREGEARIASIRKELGPLEYRYKRLQELKDWVVDRNGI